MLTVHKTWDFVKLHRKKFILAGCGLGLWMYIHYGLGNSDSDELRNYYANSIRELYIQNQNTSNVALATLLPQTLATLQTSVNLEGLLLKLKESNFQSTSQPSTTTSSVDDLSSTTTGKSFDNINLKKIGIGSYINNSNIGNIINSGDEKRRVWEEIKVSSFARAICGIYAFTCTCTIVSIQVFIIGRTLFMEHINSFNLHHGLPQQQNISGIAKQDLSTKTQQKFLSIANFLKSTLPYGQDEDPNRKTGNEERKAEGLQLLYEIVRAACEKHLDRYSLKQLVTATELSELVVAVRKIVEQETLFRPAIHPATAIPYSSYNVSAAMSKQNITNENNDDVDNDNDGDHDPAIIDRHHKQEASTSQQCVMQNISNMGNSSNSSSSSSSNNNNNSDQYQQYMDVSDGQEVQGKNLLILSQILLPDEVQHDHLEENKDILPLMNELRDILDSKEFQSVFQSVCNSTFQVFHESLALIVQSLEKTVTPQQHTIPTNASSNNTSRSPTNLLNKDTNENVVTSPQLATRTTFQLPSAHLANVATRIMREIKLIFEVQDNPYFSAFKENEDFSGFLLVLFSQEIDIA